MHTAARPLRDYRRPLDGLPAHVAAMLGIDEPAIAVLHGLHESGLVLTTHRILAWRVNGVMPLSRWRTSTSRFMIRLAFMWITSRWRGCCKT